MNAQTRTTELARALRFAIVGVSVAAVYVLLYFLLRQAGMIAWIASLLALATAFAVQYTAHTVFTFRSTFQEHGQLSRFLVTVLTGTAVSMLVTLVLVPRLGLPEWLGVGIIIFGLPIANFIIFRLWVYRAVDTRVTSQGSAK
jgi:putative flippase GtrA